MDKKDGGIGDLFERAARAWRRFSEGLDATLEGMLTPRRQQPEISKGWQVLLPVPDEVRAARAADDKHAELMGGFDGFYALLGGVHSWRTDPLKLACVHLIDRRLNVSRGGEAPWSEYLPALRAELEKQQRNQAEGIAPDADFALALRYAEAKIAANKLPTAQERANALVALDRQDRALWASRGPALPENTLG
jgi:hypothetical protein